MQNNRVLLRRTSRAYGLCRSIRNGIFFLQNVCLSRLTFDTERYQVDKEKNMEEILVPNDIILVKELSEKYTEDWARKIDTTGDSFSSVFFLYKIKIPLFFHIKRIEGEKYAENISTFEYDASCLSFSGGQSCSFSCKKYRNDRS